MWSFLKELITKQKYPVVLLLAGLAFVFLGKYSISIEDGKATLHPQAANIGWSILGVSCILGSFALFLAHEEIPSSWLGPRLQTTASGFEAKFRDMRICADFGLLESIYDPRNENSVAVLPSNEFFDDRCFNDLRTAAGSFIRQYFNPQEANALKELAAQMLGSSRSERVQVRPGEFKESFGTGTCVYLDHPLGKPHRIIFAAVATDRQPLGPSANLGTIFTAVEEIKCILASERLPIAYFPLLGAGKGGVPSEVALMALIVALLDARCKEGGHHLKEVHIVIHQQPGKSPGLSEHRTKRVIREMIKLYRDSTK